MKHINIAFVGGVSAISKFTAAKIFWVRVSKKNTEGWEKERDEGNE